VDEDTGSDVEGNDNVVVSRDPTRLRGSGNVIIGAMDDSGNTVLNRPMIVGRGASGGPNDVVIGAGAGSSASPPTSTPVRPGERRPTLTVLDRPSEIYRPFTKPELTNLRLFVEGARNLDRMALFEQIPTAASATFDVESGASSEMAEPDDEALRAALTELRQLYSHNEPHSFSRVVNMLKRSIHDRRAPLGDEAMKALERLEAANKEALAGIGLGIVFESLDGSQNKMTTAKILDAYFHGRYFHKDAGKAWLAERLDEVEPWGRYTFFTVLARLRIVYVTAADVVESILSEPALADP
jgi:hypothetical protein